MLNFEDLYNREPLEGGRCAQKGCYCGVCQGFREGSFHGDALRLDLRAGRCTSQGILGELGPLSLQDAAIRARRV